MLGDAPKSNELSEALVNIILGKKKNFERVNIAERLQEIGLLEHFPDELWAQTSAVCFLLHFLSSWLFDHLLQARELATKVKQAMKGDEAWNSPDRDWGSHRPFIFAELRK